MYSEKECKKIGKKIEGAIHGRFGWKIKFAVRPNGSFSWRKVSGRDRYDLYPGMSKQQADNAVIAEIQAIINSHLPGSRITDYQQSGRMHYIR